MTAQARILGEPQAISNDRLRSGTTLLRGQYTIESFLAAGGFGITYRAKDSLNRAVVIKECFPRNFCYRKDLDVRTRSRAHAAQVTQIIEHFTQEAHNLARVSHPNIVGVHQVFEENGTAYMALDFIRGRNLLEMLEAGRSPRPEKVQKYLRKLLLAIEEVHETGILHRDISPDNIIIDDRDEPILIDFGAARKNLQIAKPDRVNSALDVIKDGYSPQEFYMASGAQDTSCDLYSLAASFYHVITKELPPDSQRRLTAVATDEPDPYEPLAKRAKGYPRAFCESLDKAMAVIAKDRMQTAVDWLNALDTEHDNINGGPASARSQAVSFRPVLLGSAAFAALATVAFFVTTEPELPEPTGESFAAISAELVPAIQMAPVLTSDWSVRLPFRGAPNAPNTVDEVVFAGWGWLKQGVDIVSLDGQAISSIAEIPSLLTQSQSIGDKTQLDVMIGVDEGGDAGPREYVLILPVIQQIAMSDGTEFEASLRGGVWQTVVTKVSDGGGGSLRQGDVLLNYLRNGQDINQRDSLYEYLAPDLEAGLKTIPVTVRRSGDIVETEIKLAVQGS